MYDKVKQLLEASRCMDWVGRIGKKQKQRQNNKTKQKKKKERAGIGLKENDRRDGTNQEMLSLQKVGQNQIESGKSTSIRLSLIHI